MKKLKNRLLNFIKVLKAKKWYQKLWFLIDIVIHIVFALLMFKYLIVRIIVFVFVAIILIWALWQNKRFDNATNGNGVIAGGRGSGKGMLLNKKINLDKNEKHFCNVSYNNKTELINIKDYIDSIKPITTFNFINNDIKTIQKNYKYEKTNVYWDDVAVYAPNYYDNELKRYYPSLSALLPINRHLYDAYMIITTQDFERPYKLLRELQTDFMVKAIKTSGWSGLFNYLPFIRYFVFTKYIYYENKNSATAGVLPFKAKGLLNESLKHGILTAGQSTKEVYQSQHGKIFYGWVSQMKRNVNYDTRIFHEKVFGNKDYKQIMPDSEIV